MSEHGSTRARARTHTHTSINVRIHLTKFAAFAHRVDADEDQPYTGPVLVSCELAPDPNPGFPPDPKHALPVVGPRLRLTFNATLLGEGDSLTVRQPGWELQIHGRPNSNIPYPMSMYSEKSTPVLFLSLSFSLSLSLSRARALRVCVHACVLVCVRARMCVLTHVCPRSSCRAAWPAVC